jgi:glucosamine--fructose-6-phosphate aminotransferase (isomerizing)
VSQHPTAMATEIAEQPAAIERTLDALLPRRDELRRLASGRRHVLLVARGSSDNAGVYGRYLLEAHTGRGAALAAPSIATHYAARRDLSDTVVVSLSQSGETEEIVETQAWGSASGARTVAITNVEDSTLATQADLALVTPAGLERAVPATKSYTAQLAALAVLGDALGPPSVSLEGELRRVPDAVQELLDGRAGVDAAVERLASTTSTLVSGRGILYGTALEVALKLEETCLRPVRGLSYADLRHGPMAVVDDQLVAVLVAAQDGPMVIGLSGLARELRERGAAVVGVGGDAAFRSHLDVEVPGPDLPEVVAPLATIVPAQLVVEALARTLGLDPDAPRGLSKVTRTDL